MIQAPIVIDVDSPASAVFYLNHDADLDPVLGQRAAQLRGRNRSPL